jgi:hypothetical protein
MSLESFILAFILWLDPLVKHTSHEDPSVRLERLKAIAADMATVCQDPEESPVFEGNNARVKTCMLLTSIAYNESGFLESVDIGKNRGDGGKSVCIMQVQQGQDGDLHYTAEQLADRKTCIRAGLKILRRSKCNKGTNVSEMLKGYVSGTCKPTDDPNKDKKIAHTAALDARGYVTYMERMKIIPPNIK